MNDDGVILPPMSLGYWNKFVEGDEVTVLDRRSLEHFRSTWRYHHNVDDLMLEHAGRKSRIVSVAFYHGGNVLYALSGLPRMWHECLFEEARSRAAPTGPQAAGDR